MPAKPLPQGRVLIVAGSDSGGGAGVQADIKTITMLGGYAASAITALTAQNTQGVAAVQEVPPAFIRQQMALVLEDIGADAVKTGMLHRREVIEAVMQELEGREIPLVLDPVMVAKGGAPLLQPDAMDALQNMLLPRAAVITPNIPEAALLSGVVVEGLAGMQKAAEILLAKGARAVLLKGGHLEGDTLHDVLATPQGMEVFTSPRIATRHTHGTGCTLASAIATGLAQGLALQESVARAREYVRRAILAAPGFGKGHGPLAHGWPLA